MFNEWFDVYENDFNYRLLPSQSPDLNSVWEVLREGHVT